MADRSEATEDRYRRVKKMTTTIIFKQPMDYDVQLSEDYKSLRVAVMTWATLINTHRDNF